GVDDVHHDRVAGRVHGPAVDTGGRVEAVDTGLGRVELLGGVLDGADRGAGRAQGADRGGVGAVGDGDGQFLAPGVEPGAAVGGSGRSARLGREVGRGAFGGEPVLGLGAGEAEVPLHGVQQGGGGGGGVGAAGGGGVGGV